MARSKIKTLGLTDISVSNVDSQHTAAALGWQHDGARYHIWVTLPDLTPGGNIVTASEPLRLYKNPIAERGKPGYQTRRLDGSAKLGALMIAEATAYALANELPAKAIAEKLAEEAGEEATRQAAIAKRRKEDAAEAMYDVLATLLNDPMTRLSELAIAMIKTTIKLAEEGAQK